MAYIIYRCDLSTKDVEQGQMVRFRAISLTSGFGIPGDTDIPPNIDITCKLKAGVIPSPKEMYRNWVSYKDLRSAKLLPKKFIQTVDAWMSHQATKRRGTKYFVPVRGVDVDQAILDKTFDEHDLIPRWLSDAMSDQGKNEFGYVRKSRSLDIRELIKAIQEKEGRKRAPLNHRFASREIADRFAIQNRLLPNVLQPFYIEDTLPGVKRTPGFDATVEILRYVHREYPNMVESVSKKMNYAHFAETDWKDDRVEVVKAKFGRETKYLIALSEITVEGEEFTLLQDSGLMVTAELRRQPQKNLLKYLKAKEPSFFLIRTKDIPSVAIGEDVRDYDRDVQDVIFHRLREFRLNKMFRYNIRRTAEHRIRRHLNMKGVFNNAAKPKGRKKQEIFAPKLIKESKSLRRRMIRAHAQKPKDAPTLLTLDQARAEVDRLEETLVGNSKPYMECWRRFLDRIEKQAEKRREKRKAAMQKKKATAKKTSQKTSRKTSLKPKR